MPSLRSQVINTIVRNRHLMQFKLKSEVWDFNTSIPAYRRLCEDGAAKMKLPAEITCQPLTIFGITAEWVHPPAPLKDAAILFIHGGGYVSGSCSDHRGHVAKMVQGCGVSALLFDYRLAPEHPFPAGLEDTLTVYRWMLDQGYAPEKIMFAGDSAGGGLCLAALLAIRDQGLPLPAAAAAVSPWTDLALTGESYRTKAKVCLSPVNMSQVCSKYYYGDHDPTEPWISPLYGDLHGLPPLLIMAGNEETLRDDSISFAKKAQAAGVDATLRVEMGQVHCYPFLAPLFPEATAGMAEMCSFVKKHLH